MARVMGAFLCGAGVVRGPDDGPPVHKTKFHRHATRDPGTRILIFSSHPGEQKKSHSERRSWGSNSLFFYVLFSLPQKSKNTTDEPQADVFCENAPSRWVRFHVERTSGDSRPQGPNGSNKPKRQNLLLTTSVSNSLDPTTRGCVIDVLPW